MLNSADHYMDLLPKEHHEDDLYYIASWLRSAQPRLIVDIEPIGLAEVRRSRSIDSRLTTAFGNRNSILIDDDPIEIDDKRCGFIATAQELDAQLPNTDPHTTAQYI